MRRVFSRVFGLAFDWSWPSVKCKARAYNALSLAVAPTQQVQAVFLTRSYSPFGKNLEIVSTHFTLHRKKPLQKVSIIENIEM